MKNQSVAQGRFVEIEYVLSEAVDGGEVIEDCPAEQAFGFTVGAGEVLDAFEKALEGLKPGEPFDFVIPCDEAYGRVTDEAIVMIPRNVFEVNGKFDKEAVRAGEVVPMGDEDGNEVLGLILEVFDEEVEMDFNHPFADLDLHFEGMICDVRDEE